MAPENDLTSRLAWDNLQQPIHFASGFDMGCRLLLSALDLNWQVAEPVYYRPHWSEEGDWVYHFMLYRTPGEPPRLLTLKASQEVEILVQGEGWQVEPYARPTKAN